jgi:hypothetical protein
MKAIWQKWQNQIEGLLSEKQLPPPPLEFNHEHNFDLLQIPSPTEVGDQNERMIILFSRLCLCYEYGLFFEKKDDLDNFKCRGAPAPLYYDLLFGFDHGNVFSFENTNSVRLPKETPEKVRKLKSFEWFDKWNIRGLGEQKDFTHLLLYPWPQTAIILSTKLADPWLKFHIEKTFEYLRKV